MKFNLPNNLNDFDEIIHSPFCIFEKKNFLSNEIFDELSAKFPSEKIFPGKHQNGKKIFLNNKHEEFYKFIKDNIWGDFYNQFNQKKIIVYLIELIKPELEKIENRKKFNKYLITKKFSQSLYRKLINKLVRLINFDTIRIGFEFSIMKKNCYIPPHCDTENKLLSLMIYFPKNDVKDYLDLGTNFYSKKSGSETNMDIWKSEYLDIQNSEKFYENYDVFYKSKFEENKLVGFIKNEKSWHDVSQFNNDIIRKSLNINLYLD